MRARSGFTLMEILTVVAIIALLAVLGIAKYAQFAQDARRTGCLANQASILEVIGVWEVKNSTLPAPTTGSWDMLIDTRGEIAGCDARFPLLPAESPQDVLQSAGPGRGVLLRYAKDNKIFCCPERVKEAGGLQPLLAAPEGAYTFRIDSQPVPLFNGARRGVWCVRFSGANPGPDGTLETQHR